MATKIPDAQTLGVRTPSPTRQIASYDGSAGAKGMIAAGKEIQQFGVNAQAKVDEEQEQRDRFESAKAALMLDEYTTNVYDEFQKNPSDYANFEKKFNEGFSKVSQQASALITNPRQQKIFSEIVSPSKSVGAVSRVRDLGMQYQRDSDGAYLNRQSEMAAMSLMQNPSDENYRTKVSTLDVATDGSSLMPGQKENIKQSIRKQLTATMFEGLDPVEANKRLKSVVSPADVILRNELRADGVIKAKKDNKGMVIGGINEESFPAQFAEAKNILDTQGQEPAREYIRNFYQKEIIEKNGIDKLPLDVQDVVADGVTNHGSGFQKEFLEAARNGASRQDLIEMRRADYARLVDSGKPEYTSNARGWENRLKKLERSDYDVATLMQVRNRVENESVSAVFQQMPDIFAKAVDGVPYEPIDPELLAIADRKKPGMIDQYNAGIRQAEASHKMLGLAPEQIDSTLKENRPDAAKPESYAVQQEVYANLQKAAASARNRQIENTAEAAIASSAVRALAESANDSPEAMQAYLDGVKQYADDVKVYNPRLLTEEMADNYAARLTGQYENREERMIHLQDIKSRTGKYFSQVIGQTVDHLYTSKSKTAGEIVKPEEMAKIEKKANGILAAAAFLDSDSPDLTLPTTIMNWYGVSDADIEDGVVSSSTYDKPQVNAIIENDAYIAEMQDINAAMLAIDPSSSGRAKVNAMNREIARAGLVYAKMGGIGIDKGMEEAIRQARAGAVPVSQGGTIYDGSGAPPILVPLKYADRASDIQKFSNDLIDYISASKDLRVNYVQNDGPPREFEDISTSVKDNAFWISNPDKSGLMLVMPTLSGNTEVLDEKDQPITRKWDDFIIAANTVEQINKIEIPSIRANYALKLALSFPVGQVPADVEALVKQSRAAELEYQKLRTDVIIKNQKAKAGK